MTSFIVLLPVPLLAPVITDVETTNTTVTVTWTLPDELESNVTGFIIQYRPAGSTEDFSNSTVFPADNKTGVLSGLEPGEDYEIRVVAISDDQPDRPVAVSPERIVTTGVEVASSAVPPISLTSSAAPGTGSTAPAVSQSTTGECN